MVILQDADGLALQSIVSLAIDGHTVRLHGRLHRTVHRRVKGDGARGDHREDSHQRGAMLFCGRELAQEFLHRQAANKGAELHLATTMFPHEVKQLPCPYRSQRWDVLIAPRHALCFVILCDRKSTSESALTNVVLSATPEAPATRPIEALPAVQRCSLARGVHHRFPCLGFTFAGSVSLQAPVNMHEFVVEVCVVDCEDGIDVVVALVTSKCPRTCRARHEIIQESGTENSLSLTTAVTYVTAPRETP